MTCELTMPKINRVMVDLEYNISSQHKETKNPRASSARHLPILIEHVFAAYHGLLHMYMCLEGILKVLSTGEGKGVCIDVYEVLEGFIAFM
jgi:hypothetical protein